MPIRDLLWACPLCGAVSGLHADGKEERCSSCGTRFSRGRRSTIRAVRPDGQVQVRPATEWAARMPAEPSASGEADGAGQRVWRRDRVLTRFFLGDEPIYGGGVYLGAMERLGPARAGELTLSDNVLSLRLDDGEERHWPLEHVAALQASSATIQVRPRGEGIVSFAFPASSVRLWEESIAAALRRKWRSLGRGEIVEFQPRIVAR